jgi:hypothetical protein
VVEDEGGRRREEEEGGGGGRRQRRKRRRRRKRKRRRRRRNKIRKKAFETKNISWPPTPPSLHDMVSTLYCRLLLQNTATFMAFAAPSVKIKVFWDMWLCHLIIRYWCFRGVSCFHL